MGNCLQSRMRDVEVQLEVIRGVQRSQIDHLTSEVLDLKSRMSQKKNYRMSYNPNMLRSQDEIKYM